MKKTKAVDRQQSLYSAPDFQYMFRRKYFDLVAEKIEGSSDLYGNVQISMTGAEFSSDSPKTEKEKADLIKKLGSIMAESVNEAYQKTREEIALREGFNDKP